MDTESIRKNILDTIKAEEKKLLDEYKGKWVITKIYSNLYRFEKLKFRFGTVFKVESIKFKITKFDSENFMRVIVISGYDSLGKKRSTTLKLQDAQFFDDEYSAKLLLEIEEHK